MAYEKEIKSALKNKFHANLGLSDSTYEKVANNLGATIDKEEEVETVVNSAEPWLKVVQGEADIIRRTKNNPNPDPKPGGGDPNPDDPQPTNIASMIAAAIKEATTPLIQKIETLEKGNASKTNHEKLISKLTEKEIDPTFYESAIEGREFNTEDEINSFVEKLAGGYAKFNQSQADKGLLQITQPVLGGENKDGVSAATQAYIDSKKETAKENTLGGKQF